MANKRSAEADGADQGPLKDGDKPMVDADGDEVGHFEDDYEDEFESEDEIMVAGADGRPDDEVEAEEAAERMDMDQQTFIPGRHRLPAGEVLAPDLTAYDMLHTLQSSWPCLSFDVLRDNLGEGRARKKYPATVYAVAGTQTARGRERENEIMVMKLSKLSKMDKPEESGSEEDEDSDDDENTDPILEHKTIRLHTCTNRIRAHQTPPSQPLRPPSTLTAVMTESGQVQIHDITPHLTSLDTPGFMLKPEHSKPIHTIKMHGSSEGYALDWSPSPSSSTVTNPIKLLTGDTSGSIYLSTRSPTGTFTTDTQPFASHTSSVEELQWSPSEPSVFASASADSTIRIWDTRSKTRKAALTVPVSATDVNVLSWSRQTTYLLASGADDGTWATWDLRSWKSSGATGRVENPQPVASFSFHKEQITSVEWHPTDDSVVAVAAGDNTVSLWDLAVEHDDEESRQSADVRDCPPQLLFVHYMDQVKECHWHPQLEGAIMATGGSGFGVFKTISV
ncbi:MAG: ribosome biosynthesis protein rrb1 [Chrysothrix sp. TS-e1954]|nr:MAG: ribosome biosynthesis protein rrb1 [Chrysothrix sp. TS-e1954]